MKRYLLLTLLTSFLLTAQAQDPRWGNALKFDGTNDYVTVNSLPAAVAERDFTIEFWFILNNTPTDFNSLAAFNQSDINNRFESGVGYGDNQKFYVYSPYSNPDTNYGTTTIQVGVWYHVAVTYRHSDGNIEAYLNGKLELTKTMNPTYCVKATDLFSLGQEWDAPDPSAFLNGEMDEVRVWQDLRTLNEITTNMYSPLSGTEDNLLAYYKMSDASGSSLTDDSPNSYTGTLVNGTAWVSSTVPHPYAGGTGISGTPYKISTVSDLVYLSQHSSDWAKYFIQTANIDFGSDKTLVDWNGDGTADGSGTAGFSPIGNSTAAFAGNYDGKGFSISNLYINRPATDRIGLFGRIVGGTAQNIAVVNADITGQNYTGGLVGAAYETTTLVKNCRVSGSITGNQFVGGLLGDNRGGPVVQYCFSTAAVIGVSFLGGLVGTNTAVDGKIPQILNSYSHGSVTRTSGTDERVGAFLGENYSGVVSKSYCTGSVFYSGTTNPVDKGFIGKILSSTESDNFIETGVSNQTTGNGATAKTSEQMKTQSTFVNWDFATDWDIESGFFASYPYLKSITYDLPMANPALNPIPGLTLLTVTWTGASNTDWNTADNWNPAVVPTSAVDVTIPSGLTNYPVISASTNAQVKNLTHNGTAEQRITVENGGKLTVNGSYTAVKGAQIKVDGQ